MSAVHTSCSIAGKIKKLHVVAMAAAILGITSSVPAPAETLDLTPYLVKDINPGSESSSPNELARIGGTLFFNADDGVNGRELWKSDGTEAGTVLVRDINSGESDSRPRFITDLSGMAFFRADDGIHGEELWISDGTNDGTLLVRDINPGSPGSVPSDFVTFGETLFFRADDGGGFALWKSDGTEAGTELSGIDPGTSAPFSLTVVDDRIFFSVSHDTRGRELWITDGTAAGTELVKDINPGPADSSPLRLTDVGGTLFFAANDGTHGQELWKSDGTEADTLMVRDINEGGSGSNPNLLTDVNGTLFFQVNDGTSGRALWKSDGTEAGTSLVKNINEEGEDFPLLLTNVNGTLFFTARDGIHGRELWKSDGTEAGTQMVLDLTPGEGATTFSRLVAVEDLLFFTAVVPNGSLWDHGLYVSDGTEEGTEAVFLLEELNTGRTQIGEPIFTGTHLFFSAPVEVSDIGTPSNTELFAIVIPEPSALLLGLFAGLALTLRPRRGHRRCWRQAFEK